MSPAGSERDPEVIERAKAALIAEGATDLECDARLWLMAEGAASSAASVRAPHYAAFARYAITKRDHLAGELRCDRAAQEMEAKMDEELHAVRMEAQTLREANEAWSFANGKLVGWIKWRQAWTGGNDPRDLSGTRWDICALRGDAPPRGFEVRDPRGAGRSGGADVSSCDYRDVAGRQCTERGQCSFGDTYCTRHAYLGEEAEKARADLELRTKELLRRILQGALDQRAFESLRTQARREKFEDEIRALLAEWEARR